MYNVHNLNIRQTPSDFSLDCNFFLQSAGLLCRLLDSKKFQKNDDFFSDFIALRILYLCEYSAICILHSEKDWRTSVLMRKVVFIIFCCKNIQSSNYIYMDAMSQWAKIRKTVQYNEAILFVSKIKIKVFWNFFRMEWSGPTCRVRSEENISQNIDFSLCCNLATTLYTLFFALFFHF